MTAVEEPFEIDPSAPVLLEPVPPDESFWRKHSPQLEMPTSFLIATFLLTALFGVLVLFMLYAVGPGPEKKMPTMGLVDGGDDLDGDGKPGAPGGGDNAPETQAKTTTADTPPDLPTVPDQSLPAVQAMNKAFNTDDPTSPTPIAPSKVDAYGALDKAIRDQMLPGPPGAKKTGGPNGDSTGPDKGGVGADNTLRRSLRWTMMFKTTSGRDYLDQLAALGAVVLVGIPPDRKEMYIFRDLKAPKPGTVATPADFAQFAAQVQFNDAKADSVRAIGPVLGLDFTPDSFWAIFPKGIEAELAQLEASYMNRRPEDIEQTRFQVSVVGGRHKLVVADQRVRRK